MFLTDTSRAFYLCFWFMGMLLISCNKFSEKGHYRTVQDSLVDIGQLETSEKIYYEEIEAKIKASRGVQDQDKIDLIMQIMINEGDVDPPFIVEMDGAVPKIKYVTYKVFKSNYEDRQSVDSTKRFHIRLDSLDINYDLDSSFEQVGFINPRGVGQFVH